jgi:hypothetical protein
MLRIGRLLFVYPEEKTVKTPHPPLRGDLSPQERGEVGVAGGFAFGEARQSHTSPHTWGRGRRVAAGEGSSLRVFALCFLRVVPLLPRLATCRFPCLPTPPVLEVESR